MSSLANTLSRLERTVSEERQLPAACYTDAEYHDLETSLQFESGWMAIGFASAYAASGQAWSVDALGKPLLVTRDEDGALHVFHNVCRHRGHILLDQKERPGKLLRCPYHAWCYALDGRFIKAPFWDGAAHSELDDALKSGLGLMPVRFAVWYDIIFVNLSGDADAFNEFIAPMESRWARNRPAEQLRCFSTRNYSIQGNWKLAAENFLDNYHLPWIHPEVGSSMTASLGLEVENLKLSERMLGFSHPTAGADKGKTAVSLPTWPAIDHVEGQRQDLFFLFPNTCLVMEGYYLWSMILKPTAVGSCDEQLALYVVGDEALDPRFEVSRQQLSEVIYKINNQDEMVIRQLQRGRQSDAGSSGVYNAVHDQLGKLFHQSVASRVLSNYDSLNPERESDEPTS